MAGIRTTDIQLLKHLGLRGCINELMPLSSSDLAKDLQISQQTASGRILHLLELGLIERQIGAPKPLIRITSGGVDVLRKEFADYQRLFEISDKFRVHGILFSGLGEGQYYISQRGYMDQFREKLWFEPFPGTLNLKIIGSELSKLEIIREMEGITIVGFESEGRTFGGGKCFLCEIHDTECAIMIPKRTHYNEVIEIISKRFLREHLKLKDGDIIEVLVHL